MAGTPNGLAQGTNGILYGTTYAGGTHLSGTVFSLTTNGTFTTLLSFTGRQRGESDCRAGARLGRPVLWHAPSGAARSEPGRCSP